MKKFIAILVFAALAGSAFADPTATLHVRDYTDNTWTSYGDTGIRVHFAGSVPGQVYELNTGWVRLDTTGTAVAVRTRPIAGWIGNGGPDSPATFPVTVYPAVNGVTSYGTETFVLDWPGRVAGHGDNTDHSTWVDVFYGTASTAGDPNATKPTDRMVGGKNCIQPTENDAPVVCLDCGMPRYSILELLVSLHLADSPLSYTPAFGPPLNFTVSYNHRDVQPTVPDTAASTGFSNFGPQWTFNWLSYVTDDPNNGAANVSVYVRGGGTETYTGYDPTTQSWARDPQSHALLVRTAIGTYQKQFPDGYVYVFGQSDGSAGYPRHIFLSAVIDPQGNEVDLNYDGNNRLQTIKDATQKVTTFYYDDAPGWYYRVTRVVDPFGRTASFQYYDDGRLFSMTDAVNLTSSVVYETGSNFVSALNTPYGQTTFSHGENGTQRWIETADPLNGKERVEFRDDAPGIADAEASAPAGFFNTELQLRNTFYWDKKAYAVGYGDYTKAHVTHWLESADGTTTIGIVENEKPALENRIWYTYDGQTAGNLAGTSNRPTQIARQFDGGGVQLTQFTYNSLGYPLSRIDPVGRSTAYTYQANNADLWKVTQTNGANSELLLTLDNYAGHHPQTITDAAGQQTNIAYNGRGQVQSVTNAKGEVTQFAYDETAGDAAFARLLSVTRAFGTALAAPSTYGYDGFGRVQTITDSAGYTITLAYDAVGGVLNSLDRPTRVTYPDGTYREARYDNASFPLDVAHSRDRLGQETASEYDALRHQVKVTDPQNRVTQFVYCACGALDKIIDPNNNQTVWTRDLERRILTKSIAGQIVATYTYEPDSGRLSTITDALSQVTTYGYNLDNSLASTTYAGSVHTTANVSFTYDPAYPRMASMTDGTGTTNYGYYPVAAGTLGAGQVNTVGVPVYNAPGTWNTITYTYDELGRVNGRSINGAANTTSVQYDALGRVSVSTNPLGEFDAAYLDQTARLDHVLWPNGQRTNFTWKPNLQDERLDTITHLNITGQTQSQHSYGYDAEGKILTWQTIIAGNTAQYTFGYNASDELENAVQLAQPAATTLHNLSYGYDGDGNRLAVTEDGKFTSYTPNGADQLTTASGSGPMEFRGTVSKASTITLAGQPVTMNGLNWSGWANVAPGANSLQLSATETAPPAGSNPKTTTRHINLTLSADAARTFVYDGNGSMSDNGASQTYEWDAANRMTAINYTGTNLRTEFTYDGLNRWVAIVEKNSGAVTGEKHFVWDGFSLAEERDANNNVTKQFYGQGELRGTLKLYYAKDHLGNVREVTDGNGVMRARYDYVPWGGRSANAITDVNALECDFGFTGHYQHGPSGLLVAPRRFYSGDLGRWLSRDPIGERGGINLYRYVGNGPVNAIDPFGMWQFSIYVGEGWAGYISFGNNGGTNPFNGQWNIAAEPGVGVGASISFDWGSHCKKSGYGGVLTAAGTLGEGYLGAGFQADADSNQGYDAVGNLRGGVWGGTHDFVSGATSYTGLANYGASVFAGGGMSFAQ